VKVVFASSIPYGGPVSHLRELVPWVAREGVEVAVVCGDETVAAAFRKRGIEAHVAPLRRKLDLAGARSFGRLLRDADIVHTHDRRTGLLVRTQARARGIGVLHTFHGLPEEIAAEVGRDSAPPLPPGVSSLRASWLRHGYLRLEAALAALGLVVTPSEAMGGYLVRRGLPARRVRVVRHGMATRVTAPPPVREQGPLVVAAGGIIEHWKGYDVLVEACALASEHVRLEVYGDGSLRKELALRANRLGVDSAFPGWVPDGAERLSRADVVALSSRAENAPLVLLEAMANGIPVVATRVGGVPELVEDGVSGVLVPPDDAKALAAAFDSLARDPSLRTRLGRGGLERVASRFRPEDAARSLVALYEEVAGGRRR
jgi:glycosyltransferase involved in cell wall biosynthesis